MIAVLIYAHKEKEQVQRLINTLVHKDVDIYVHCDSKFEVNNFNNAIMIKKRYDCGWGKPDIINSIISSLKEIKEYKKYDYYILLSGQDYLIISINKIVKFLNKNKGKEFIEYKKIGKKDDEWDISNRYSYYRFNNSSLLDKISRYLYNKRKFINNLTPYGGSLWWMLTDDAINYIINYYDENKLYKSIRYTSCFDEVFFQSILCNSKFIDNVVNNNYHYIDWSEHIEKKNKGNPNTLKIKDYNKIINSNKFIARKFDIKVDGKILDKLDEVRK